MTLTDIDIGNLFVRLANLYGTRWTSSRLTDRGDVWLEGLQGLTAEDLSRGIARCRRIGSDRARTGDEDWPPTCGEFRAYCERSQRSIYQPFPALPHCEARPEVRERELAKMREALGMPK